MCQYDPLGMYKRRPGPPHLVKQPGHNSKRILANEPQQTISFPGVQVTNLTNMQLTTVLLPLLVASSSIAAAVESRIPRLGAFGVSTTFGCPLVNQEVAEFALGQQSDTCRTFYNNTTYAAINVYYWVPQCLLTIYNTHDCSEGVSEA